MCCYNPESCWIECNNQFPRGGYNLPPPKEYKTGGYTIQKEGSDESVLENELNESDRVPESGTTKMVAVQLCKLQDVT